MATTTYTMADGTTRTLESREDLPRLTGGMAAVQLAADVRLDAIGRAAARIPAAQFAALLVIAGDHTQAGWWTWGDVGARVERSAAALLAELDECEVDSAEIAAVEARLAR